MLRAHPGRRRRAGRRPRQRAVGAGDRRARRPAPDADVDSRGTARRVRRESGPIQGARRSSSSSTRCAGSATARPTTGGRKAKRRRQGTDMTHKAIDCLVNVHFGETAKQPEFMLKVRDDYFKGPTVAVRPGRTAAAARGDGRTRRRQGHPDGQPGQAVGDRPHVRRGAARQVRVGDWRGQPAAPGARTARARCRAPRPAGGVYRCRAELLGRRHVSAERCRLLPAVREVRRTRTAAVHQHRAARARRSPARRRTRSTSTGCACASRN